MSLESAAAAAGYLVPDKQLEKRWRLIIADYHIRNKSSDGEWRQLVLDAIKEASRIELSDAELDSFLSGASIVAILGQRHAQLGNVRRQIRKRPQPPLRVSPAAPAPSPVECYRCHKIVLLKVEAVYDTTGYVGVDLAGTDATGFRPITEKRYVGVCPYCGAQHASGEADRLNKEKEETENSGCIAALVLLALVALFVGGLMIAALADGSMEWG